MSEASQTDIGETPAASPSVVMLSGDLMFASRVKAAAERAGLEFRFGGALPADNTDAIRFVVLDLSTRSGLTAEIAGQCAERCAEAKLIAYGPHVHVERLKAARQAGIETVLTNGQFDAGLGQLFTST
jgi:hypothetical protein